VHISDYVAVSFWVPFVAVMLDKTLPALSGLKHPLTTKSRPWPIATGVCGESWILQKSAVNLSNFFSVAKVIHPEESDFHQYLQQYIPQIVDVTETIFTPSMANIM
jgi:hypothetical protein